MFISACSKPEADSNDTDQTTGTEETTAKEETINDIKSQNELKTDESGIFDFGLSDEQMRMIYDLDKHQRYENW